MTTKIIIIVGVSIASVVAKGNVPCRMADR